jgi:hypothetical protein
VGVLHPTLTDGRKEQSWRKSNFIFGFQTVRLEGRVEVGNFFPLGFSFIVITKYIPVMENYGFLLAI